MEKIICFLFGHKSRPYLVRNQFTPGKKMKIVARICTRCGKWWNV